MRFIGLVLLVVFLVLGSGSAAHSMIDPPSLIITLGGMIAALLLAGVNIPVMAKVFFSDAEPDQVREGISGWKLAAVFALVMGSVGTLIGLVIMLKNMDDPAAIGPGFAIANLTSIYALMMAFAVCLPVYKSLERKG